MQAITPVAAGHAGTVTIADALHKNGYKLFSELMKLAKAAEGAQDPYVHYTVLAPTDKVRWEAHRGGCSSKSTSSWTGPVLARKLQRSNFSCNSLKAV